MLTHFQQRDVSAVVRGHCFTVSAVLSLLLSHRLFVALSSLDAAELHNDAAPISSVLCRESKQTPSWKWRVRSTRTLRLPTSACSSSFFETLHHCCAHIPPQYCVWPRRSFSWLTLQNVCFCWRNNSSLIVMASPHSSHNLQTLTADMNHFKWNWMCTVE